jgi:hypothetical protein
MSCAAFNTSPPLEKLCASAGLSVQVQAATKNIPVSKSFSKMRIKVVLAPKSGGRYATSVEPTTDGASFKLYGAKRKIFQTIFISLLDLDCFNRATDGISDRGNKNPGQA